MTAPLLIISIPEYPGKKFAVLRDPTSTCGDRTCAFDNTRTCFVSPVTADCADKEVYFKEVECSR